MDLQQRIQKLEDAINAQYRKVLGLTESPVRVEAESEDTVHIAHINSKLGEHSLIEFYVFEGFHDLTDLKMGLIQSDPPSTPELGSIKTFSSVNVLGIFEQRAQDNLFEDRLGEIIQSERYISFQQIVQSKEGDNITPPTYDPGNKPLYLMLHLIQPQNIINHSLKDVASIIRTATDRAIEPGAIGVKPVEPFTLQKTIAGLGGEEEDEAVIYYSTTVMLDPSKIKGGKAGTQKAEKALRQALEEIGLKTVSLSPHSGKMFFSVSSEEGFVGECFKKIADRKDKMSQEFSQALRTAWKEIEREDPGTGRSGPG